MSLQLKRAAKFPPREPRAATHVMTTVLLLDGRELRILIKNITGRGFMATTSAAVEVDTELGVALPCFGIVRARVRWIDDRDFGAVFNTALPVEAFNAF